MFRLDFGKSSSYFTANFIVYVIVSRDYSLFIRILPGRYYIFSAERDPRIIGKQLLMRLKDFQKVSAPTSAFMLPAFRCVILFLSFLSFPYS